MARGKVEASSKRRAEILAAALEVFTAKGFAETTMQDIHALSGASMGSIYHHFESKERLAADLYVAGLSALHNEMLRSLTGKQSAETGIKRMVLAYIRWFKQQPDWGLYLFQGLSAQYLEVDGERVREENARLRREMWEWLHPHIASGAIADLPRELYGPLMLGPTREFLQQWLIHRTPANVTRMSHELADAAWRAVAPSSRVNE